MTSFMDRVKVSFNILLNRDPFGDTTSELISSLSTSQFPRVRYDTTEGVLAPIKTRIAMDAANVPIKHVLVDDLGQFLEIRTSELNDRINIMANVDQTGRAFRQDVVMTMLEEGACALVPVDISASPSSGSYEILSMRVGVIEEWYSQHVRVELYNEKIGDRTSIVLPKWFVAICYNPLYPIMNATNSTLRRLIDKLALLDVADARLYSKQLDLIFQLPFSLKNEKRQEEAARRLAILEAQLYDKKYGIGYIDATEKITQLNRPVTNSLVDTIKGLMEDLYSQLGLTPNVVNGTASPEEMLQYNNRTVLPIIRAFTEAMIGTFFSRTAIRQGNSIMAFPDLFKMAPLLDFAEAADKLTRNAIMTSNEIRAQVGLKPSSEPDADALRNKNLNVADNTPTEQTSEPEPVSPSTNGSGNRIPYK